MELYNITTSLPTSPICNTTHDVVAAGLILTTFSSILFVAACLILFLYYWGRIGRFLVETRIGIVIFFLGALLTTLTTLAYHVHESVYGTYRLFLAVCIGIVLLIAGTFLFDNPSARGSTGESGRPLHPVGHTHGNIGMVIWVITLPLCALELLYAIGAATKSTKPIYAAIEFVSLIQKITQAAIYHFSLRHKIPKPSMKMGCSWYLKIISLLNFAFWIDSIITSHTDNEFVMNLFGKGFSIIKTAYNALIIDYRLLCSLLFLEHALELEDSRDTREEQLHEPIDERDETLHDDPSAAPRPVVNVQIIHYTGYGYVIGLVCIGLQLVNGLQYLGFVGPWSSIFPILSNLVVIVSGLILVKGRTMLENNVKWRETESKAIDVMVGFMGAIGLVFRFMKSSFCILLRNFETDSELRRYLVWNSAKEAARAVSIFFQLYFFVKMSPHFFQEPRNRNRRICHILVPAIMLALLSIFLSAIIDQYNGPVEHLIHQAWLDGAVVAFFNAAAPIHLGFSLHMFLYFYIMRREMSGLEFVRRSRSFLTTTSVVESNESDEQIREPLLRN